jgi:hypothetical protein
MKMRRASKIAYYTTAFLACVVVVVLVVAHRGSSRASNSLDTVAPGSHWADVARKVDDHEEKTTASLQREPAPTQAEPVLTGKVLSTDGRPIAGASVQWAALRKGDTEPNHPEPTDDWGVRSCRAAEASTDSEGTFILYEQPEPFMPHGSTLTVDHPGHFIGGLDLGADRPSWPSIAVVVLQPAHPTEVRVVSQAGTPVADAIVHRAPIPRLDFLNSPAYERIYEREFISCAEGTVNISAFDGEQVVWAEKGGSRSIPWRGSGTISQITLVMGQAFFVGGTIAYPDRENWDAGYDGERRISISGLQGGVWKSLIRIRDVRDGEWGPIGVPLGDFPRFLIRFDGIPITPIEREFSRPKPGEQKRFDLVGEKNAELYLYVENEDHEPIGNARATAWWSAGQSTARKVHVAGASRPDGYLYLGTFPPGTVRAQVSAPGYGYADVENAVPMPFAAQVTLFPSGRIEGRCVNGENPVRDFDVVYWREGSMDMHRRQSFYGREDGSFVLDDVVPGEWAILAATEGSPGGPMGRVQVSLGTVARVELGVHEPLLGFGRVLDAETGLPLVRAKVQAFTPGGLKRSFAWGVEVDVSSDGIFELTSFVPGLNFITIGSEGYGLQEARKTAVAGQPLDWGDIRLYRTQRFALTLLGVRDGGLEPTRFLVSSVDTEPPLPAMACDSEGVAEFTSVAAGDYRVLITHPNGDWDRVHLRLDSGANWSFDHKVSGSNQIEVYCLDNEGKPTLELGEVVLSCQEENGLVLRSRIPDMDGKASFEGVRADRAQVLLVSTVGEIVHTRDVLASSANPTVVEILVGGESTLVHVVDGRGAPVVGAWVTIRSRDGAVLHCVDETNSEGIASLAGAPRGAVLLDLKHGALGRRIGIPAEASAGRIEVVLEAQGGLDVRVRDGDLPLAGVSVRMTTGGGTTLSEVLQTNSEGACRFEALGEGNVRLACHRSDCWPAVLEHAIGSEGGCSLDVDMRRLGDLEVVVTNRDALPVAALALELRSLEFDADVAAWLAAERIRAPAGLTTDGLGRLVLEGLPRGTYAWGLAGKTMGTFEVPAGKARVALVFSE